MVLDYSKWDALELSDDSDIEVHPNVDKRSFIRAKQNQIHQQRYDRRHQIETLKYEHIINNGLLQRIDALLASLRSHEASAKGSSDGFMMQALMECAGDPSQDEPPKPPEGVHSKTENPRYSQMMASLVDQVKEEVGDSEDWHKAYIKGVEGHRQKVLDLNKELLQKLDELEKEEGRKITSDSIHTGFNTSSVSKADVKPKPATKQKAETVEVLNPSPGNRKPLKRLDSQSSGAEGDLDEPIVAGADPDDEHIETTVLGKQFAKIKVGDYKASLKFISEHHEVVAEHETDGLLMEAFNAQMDGHGTYAKQCVHQALLLQYCRSLGKDGVGLFFKRFVYPTPFRLLCPCLTFNSITTPGHQAQKVFLDDVNSTYVRIRTRTAELAKERAANPKEQDVEQIQLHAVEPGTSININVPQPNSSDDIEIKAREIFERFPPGLQRALETGSLDRVNEVLGKMSVEEAEEVVEQLGSGGMLSVEEGVIDGTTAEGKQKLKELEKQAEREKKEREVVAGTDEEVEVAGPD